MSSKQPKRTIVQAVGFIFATALFVHATLAQDLPTGTSTLFAGSGKCTLCHTSDGDALQDSRGTDLSLTTNWRSTMMANAARDPLWQAKVETEVREFPALQEIIEDKCTTCHTPMGRTQAKFEHAGAYSLEDARADALAMDGVSCTLCHQIQPDNLGQDDGFSGGYVINEDMIVFGPYPDPLARQMEVVVNYTPAFGSHMQRSELCATCHTLFTPFVDDAGEIAGTFPEQVPYLEWQNSRYAQEGQECQDCHMPRIDEPIKISTLPNMLAPRSPFWRHLFVGGNTFMLSMLRDNGVEIGATASQAQFDSTINHTLEQLQERSVRLTADASVAGDQLALTVTIENRTGHKFPTGFPSRRAWLHVLVTDGSGEIVFESGGADDEGRIVGLETSLEPHRDQIDAEGQVQIYESRMIDTNGDLTTTLLRAADYIKDNRIPPRGFVTDAERYSDMAIRGAANDDSNFNRDMDGEGSGSDTVTYRVDLNDQSGTLSVQVDLFYQSASPGFVGDLLAYDTPAVAEFQRYYDRADKTPKRIQSIATGVDRATGIDFQPSTDIPTEFALLPNYPNPFNTSTVIPYRVSGEQRDVGLAIYDLHGRRVRTLSTRQRTTSTESMEHPAGSYFVMWDGTDENGLAVASGMYLYRLETDNYRVARKMILIK